MNKFAKLCAAVVTLSVMQSVALAASSNWVTTEGAKVRLISLPSPDGKSIQAGLQIELDKGWKTYWRSPGASGLPPQLSFQGSQNVASTKMHFPVPSTFGDSENLTAGYNGSVTLPIDVEPLYANRPVSLFVTGLIGVCAEICIPFQFSASLKEDGRGFSSPDVASVLFQSKAKLPAAPSENFKVTSSKIVEQHMVVEALVPKGTVQSTLFVEGPSNWYLTPTKATNIEGDKAVFKVSLMDIPKDAKPTSEELQFSLVADGNGIFQKMTPQP